MASSEIETNVLKCNTCWQPIGGSKQYKTACNHLFCRACSEKYFSKRMVCPLCEASVEGDGGLVELITLQECTPEVAMLAYAYAACKTEEALRVATDALLFARSQTALYGTREIWLRNKKLDDEKRKVVDAENKINSVMHELSAREGVVKEQAARIEAQGKMLAEAERKMKAYEALYAEVTGRPSALAMGQGAARGGPPMAGTPGPPGHGGHGGGHGGPGPGGPSMGGMGGMPGGFNGSMITPRRGSVSSGYSTLSDGGGGGGSRGFPATPMMSSHASGDATMTPATGFGGSSSSSSSMGRFGSMPQGGAPGSGGGGGGGGGGAGSKGMGMGLQHLSRPNSPHGMTPRAMTPPHGRGMMSGVHPPPTPNGNGVMTTASGARYHLQRAPTPQGHGMGGGGGMGGGSGYFASGGR